MYKQKVHKRKQVGYKKRLSEKALWIVKLSLSKFLDIYFLNSLRQAQTDKTDYFDLFRQPDLSSSIICINDL